MPKKALFKSAFDSATTPADVLAFHRAIFGDARMSTDDPPAATDGEQGAGVSGSNPDSDASNSDTGQPAESAAFPADTPLAEMSVEQREAYWKHQARKHESRVKAQSDYDEIKAKAEQFDEQQRQSETDHERALREAVEQTRAEVMQQSNERAAAAILQANLSARNVASDIAELILSGFSPSNFLKDDGDVDTDKVSQLVAAIAPTTPSSPKWPDMGQGKRESASTSSTQAGREAYRARHQKNNTNA